MVKEIRFLKKITSYALQKKKTKSEYWLTRYVLLRILGIVYLFAFLSLVFQVIPLIGHDGLLPADQFLQNVVSHFGSEEEAFNALPSIFYFNVSDSFMLTAAWIGVLLAIAVVLGYANVPILFFLWIIFFSFNHIGQLWYGYGWEIQLIETGFLALFIVPLLDPRPFPKFPMPTPIVWLFRWLAFRIHIGAGLIKMRGDGCWKDLTCLYYHYQTQPIPNPLSPYFHFMPKWFHRLSIIASHFFQLIVPWFIFNPRKIRHIAGSLLLFFQLNLIVSGNLSYLNWVTMVPIIACFDDTLLKRFLPKKIINQAEEAEKKAKTYRYQHWITWAVVAVVILLSFPVVHNLLSPQQAMNTSFNKYHVVNTYGAFGSIGKVRHELIIEGTADVNISPSTEWKPYEFFAKPGNEFTSHPLVAPYQPRIAWQIWFAAFSSPEREPWLIHLIWKMLNNNPTAKAIPTENPFPNTSPEYIRIQFYEYQFAKLHNPEGKYWERKYIGQWLPPVSAETPEMQNFIKQHGWD